MEGRTTSVVGGWRFGARRLLAVFAAFAMLGALMVVYAAPARAHHPEIDAGQSCINGVLVVTYQAVSWKTDGTAGSGHDDIRIEIRLDGSGSWIEVAADEFSAANGFEFDGTIPGGPLWGRSVELRARADGPWDNGNPGGQTRSTYPFEVNQDCYQQDEPVTVAIGHGSCQYGDDGLGSAFVAVDPAGGATVTIEGPGGPYVISDAADLELAPGYYTWSAAAADGYELVSESEGDFTIHPCEVDVLVSHGSCSGDGAEMGFVSVEIDPSAAAKVVVDGPGGPYEFSGDGGSQSLEPGDYSWTAEAVANFAITGDAAGHFTVEPCQASVVVSHGDCAVGDGVEPGYVEVGISPASAAKVVVSDEGGEVVSIDGNGGKHALAAGDYTWVAVAGDGFALSGDTSGAFTVDDCEEVLDDAITSVQVSAVCEDGEGVVMVTMASGVERVVLTVGSEETVVTGSGDVRVPSGSTVTWSATASEGYVFADGGDAGQLEIGVCDEVEDEEVLPFTGLDTWLLGGLSLVLLAAGLTLVHMARQREEGER